MQTVALSWQQAGLLAAGLAAVSVGCRYLGSTGSTTDSTSDPAVSHPARGRRVARLAPFAGEAAIIAVLYGLWQLAGTVSLVGTRGAYARGRDIVGIERDLHLPAETDVQHLIVGHRLACEFCNLYYAGLHFVALGALLVWLFVRHRHEYARVRTTIVLLTGSCLLIQLLPVAPPRLLPEYGFVDVAARYGQSVYGGAFAGLGPDQLSAMPSVHVGWATLIAVTIVRVSRSRWRWLALAYPALTFFVVVATGNHFWLDGIVAIALLGGAELVQAGARRLRVSRADTRQPELLAA